MFTLCRELGWYHGMVAEFGVWCWRSGAPLPVAWGGSVLKPGEVYHGIVRDSSAVSRVLGQYLAVCGAMGGSRGLMIDLAGIVAEPLCGVADTWAMRIDEEALLGGSVLAMMRGAFDVGVIVVEGSHEEAAQRRRLALRWGSMLKLLPKRPWVVLGVGGIGYRDPWLRVVRDCGIPLASL